MTISQVTSVTTGFRKWSAAHAPASNDDDHPGSDTPIALITRERDEPPEQSNRPWLVSGIGSTL